jgi:acetyl-CoA carboxylase biotin carboxyl carrier protein
MNIRQIRLLAQVMEESALTVLEVSEGDSKIRMERSGAQLPAQAAPAPGPQPIAQALDHPASHSITEEALDFNRLTEVACPMIGVFYAAPSPEAAPFVKRGDRVKKGDVLCIIEAMKLLNEIVAEADGEIADICVHNGQVVEFGQTLFKLF